MKLITCIRCKGKGVHMDKLNVDGGVYTCGLCNGTGYLEPVITPTPMTKEEREKKVLEAWAPETSLEDQKRLLGELL